MKQQKKAALYLIYYNKWSEDRCQRSWGPRTVKPIFTFQPSDLTNYSLFLRADRGDYQHTMKERGFFSSTLCLNLFGPTHAFSLTTCLASYIHYLRPSLEILNICDTPMCIFMEAYVCGSECGDVMRERVWQLYYLRGVSLSACTFPFFGPTVPIKHLHLLSWQTLSRNFCLSVSVLGLLYC